MNDAPSFIGYSPAGIAWYCYREPGQTDAEHAAACREMRAALAALLASAALRTEVAS